MRFQQFEAPPHLAGCIGYAAFDFDVSFVVSFDNMHPDQGWRASYRKNDGDVIHLPQKYGSKRAAIRALKIERKRVAQ